MDRISQLSDELLLKILSVLPTTNEVVATMVLSKRWQFLWKMVPKLVYDDSCYKNIDYARFSRFVYRSLFLHETPVIETLHFKLGKSCGPDDIQVWIRAAEKCCLRELILESNIPSKASRFILPRSFYTACRMLVTLNLSSAILADVSSPISFPSLKNLSLLSVKYPSEEFFNMLLSNCPVLEDLVLDLCVDDNVSISTVRVPSLKSLSLYKLRGGYDADGTVINAPSLVRLKITDYTDGFCVIENEMPMIVTVDVDIPHSNLGKILGSVTSVKSLYLCFCSEKDPNPVGNVFHQLVSLNLCRCDEQWLNLLMRVLENSPNLRALTLDQYHGFQEDERSLCWTKPNSVPDCLLSSLETLEWEDYEGAEEEKELVEYILKNGACLKKVTISSIKSTNCNKKLEMIKVLTMSIRRSPTCQLVFN